MTDTHHLDDEALSAVLDGDAAPPHLGGCASCTLRLAELRLAVDAVSAAPPALTEARRRTMLDRALGGHGRTDGGEERPPDDRVVPLRRPSVARWSGIAAVLVVLIGIGALVTGRGGDDRDMAASGAADEAATLSAAPADERPTVDGGDLGSRRDPAELGGIIRDAVAGQTAMASPAPAAGSGGGSSADVGAEAESATRSAGLPCRAEARAEYGTGIGPLVYGALVAWEDVPAVVLAYERDAGDGKVMYLGLVLARDGCRTLTSIFQTS